LAAASRGASVIMLEKMAYAGGTTMKSGGVFWIPNNPVLRAKGIVDKREDALRYMARMSFPDAYRPDDSTLGLAEFDYGLLAAYYDHASPVIEELMQLSPLKIMPWLTWENKIWPDYFGFIPENKIPEGRALVCDLSEYPDRGFWMGGGGRGAGLIWVLQKGFKDKPIDLRLQHRVQRLTRDADGRISGVEADAEGKALRIRAKRSVVFASGGFTHNPTMARSFLKGNIWGGCANVGSTGDFIPMAMGAGAALGNLHSAWWAQVPVELALQTRSVPYDVWVTPGDSMIQVNRHGQRWANEKIAYNERTQRHFIWKPEALEHPNRLSFMLWDERTAQAYAGYYPIPKAQDLPSHVIKGNSLAELQDNIGKRLARLAEDIGGLTLADDFAANLKREIGRFNEAAKTGVDQTFHRGETPNERAFQFWGIDPLPDNPYPNATMYPIAASGPYYAVILGAGTLDTKGGPVMDASGRVLDTQHRPIPGLFGAGNCIAAPAHQAYWSGGATIGSATVFGFLAGATAAGDDDEAA
ncbi:MAG: FAD-binding protein, partial [Salinisphaera sp.]|nr:FAD-binding protein [Salinisphaera sp.]